MPLAPRILWMGRDAVMLALAEKQSAIAGKTIVIE
jgi:hypothetical protein